MAGAEFPIVLIGILGLPQTHRVPTCPRNVAELVRWDQIPTDEDQFQHPDYSSVTACCRTPDEGLNAQS
jgi:hypothetical protein